MIEFHKDILPENIVEDLELYLSSDRVQWTYLESTVHKKWDAEYNDHPDILESPQLVRLVYGDNKVLDTEIFHRCAPIIQNFWHKKGIKSGRIHKIKVNTLMKDSEFQNNKFNGPHADFVNTENEQNNFTSLLYYVNDSDGDTYFFNNYDRRINPYNEEFISKKFDLIHERAISPQRGCAVSFPSNQYHASSNPVKTKRRLVINFVMDCNDANN